jgi:hypothetical protein
VAWMLDVHLYFTGFFFGGGVSIDYGGVVSYSVVGRLVRVGSRMGYLLLYTVTSH